MLELFHSTTDGGESAPVRGFIVERGLTSIIRFRNVTYEEVTADFKARGGTRTPAVWDGERLTEGREAVLRLLAALPVPAPLPEAE